MNPRFWKWIFIGLAFGFGLEIIKAPMRPSVQIAGFAKLDDILDEGKPVYNQGHQKADRHRGETRPEARRSHGSPQRIAPSHQHQQEVAAIVRDFVPSSNTLNPAPVAGVTPQPTPPPTEAQKKAEAEKRRKAAFDKRKEQEKQVVEAMQEQERLITEQQAEVEKLETEVAEEKQRRDSENYQAPLFIPTPTPTPAPAGSGGTTVVSNIPQSVREWEAALLKEPDAAETAQFVQYYKSGKIKKEVFFAIVRMMVEDSRPSMRKLGIKSASEVMDSQSFSILAQASLQESDIENKALATESLQDYSLPQNVSHLSAFIDASQEPQLTFVALEYLKQSVDGHLRTLGSSSQGGNNSSDANKLMGQYNPFVSLLQAFLDKNHDPQLGQNAAQLLNELRGILEALQ